MPTQSPSQPPPLLEALAELNGQASIRVLHVDDEPDFAEVAGVYMEREEDALDVETVTSASDALDRLDQGPRIDCVVSDYDMPGMDGLALLDVVREEFSDLPFILFTGKGSEGIASEAISRGVTDYLRKQSGTDQYAVLANRVTNVVRRHRAEQEVQNSYRAMETAREGIGLLDEHGRFRYVNSAYAEIYGYDRAELVGEHWEILYPDAHVEQVCDEILPSVPETGRWTGESVHRTADGEEIVVDHVLAYTDADAMICLVRDVAETQDRTRDQSQFELFVEAVEEYAIFTLDPDGYITSWNDGAERITGYDGSEIIGEHVSTFYPDNRNEAYPDHLLADALDDGTTTVEGPRVREDGSQFPANVTISAVRDGDDRHRGFLQVVEDRTEAYEAQARLDDAHDKLQTALNLLEDIFYVIDPEGNFELVTDRAVEVTGYSRQELLTMEPAELFAEADGRRIAADIEQALAEGESRIEAELVTSDGRTIPYEFRKRRIVDADGTVLGVAGIGRDITERKRRERQLRQQLEQFEHFGSVLSHDLRTPLETARGRLELFRETGDGDHLDAAETALGRLDELIGDLSSVLREAEIVTDVRSVSLVDAVESVWVGLESEDATLAIQSDGRIQADETALKRLLENLLKNTFDHGGDEVTVTVGALPNGFYVEDDGPGIPESERDRVFEAGYTTSEEGSGFGLASVRQIAVSHGWQIAATTGDDGGARFEVTDVRMAVD
ncbi:PAS domain S-box protein [Halapricum desulfuricans]|nr:PAS domain S-box protein [Halapricum desulfuricans]